MLEYSIRIIKIELLTCAAFLISFLNTVNLSDLEWPLVFCHRKNTTSRPIYGRLSLGVCLPKLSCFQVV